MDEAGIADLLVTGDYLHILSKRFTKQQSGRDDDAVVHLQDVRNAIQDIDRQGSRNQAVVALQLLDDVIPDNPDLVPEDHEARFGKRYGGHNKHHVWVVEYRAADCSQFAIVLDIPRQRVRVYDMNHSEERSRGRIFAASISSSVK